MGARILLVDDEKEFAEALAERLVMRDYEVTICLSGEDAIERAKALDYDVVILDEVMPGMGGVETLREIRKTRPLVEVIMLSGRATIDQAIGGLQGGAFHYLKKPCETEELLKNIEEAYQRRVAHKERIRQARLKAASPVPGAASIKGQGGA
jgi:DNA-binding response OmpR family regulator